MARINIIVCDLCKEVTREAETIYTVVISSYKTKDFTEDGLEGFPQSKKNGEICLNCHRSLVARLKKSPDDLFKSENTQRATQFAGEDSGLLGAMGQKFKEKSLRGLHGGQNKPEDISQIDDGEFKVKSKAHTISRPLPAKCQHDKKSFGDDGRFICLICDEILGAVQ